MKSNTITVNAMTLVKTKESNLDPHLQNHLPNRSANPSILPSQKSLINYTNAGKELPIQFIGRGEVKGRQFTQFLCSNMAYLYQVQSSGRLYWEVFKRRQNLRFGNVIYPSSKAFGKWAWTFSNYEDAMKRFDELNKENPNDEFE